MRTRLAIATLTSCALLSGLVAGCGEKERNANISDAGDDNGRPGRPDVIDDTSAGDAALDTGPADTSDDLADSGNLDAVDTTDASDGSGDADTTDASDTGETSDTAPDIADVEPEVVACPPSPPAFTGVSALDVNGDPLEVDDVIEVSIALAGTSDLPLALAVRAVNLNIVADSIEVDGVPAVGASVTGGRMTLPLATYSNSTVTLSASVVAVTDLVTIFAELTGIDGVCLVERSRSGAILQVVGGSTKTPACVDMREVRSVQVAPIVALQNTNAYASANGRRTDLRADNFIFCPQSPTIVHTAEFCIERAPDQEITLAGSATGGGEWEVDDFILFEVFRGSTRLADGFTSQRHNGGSTFWCGEIGRLMCETPCTAELIDIDETRSIEAIAVAPAQGASARRHADDAVSISDLLPADGSPVDVRITALDQGVEGTLRPGLYLRSSAP
jgi:hypothetical protein